MTYYELSNHLGNVLVTVTDMKIGIENDFWTAEYYEATVVSVVDYYPFGSAMAGRKYNQGTYRYGFNGMEKDDEVKGEGNSYDFGARIFDSRIGRWISLDPAMTKYRNLSPYNMCENNPIYFADPNGEDAIVTVVHNENGGGIITISSTVYLVGLNAKQTAETLNATSAFLKGGIYKDEKGNSYSIKFDVKYKYAESIDIELGKGENMVKLSAETENPSLDRRSHTTPILKRGWYNEAGEVFNFGDDARPVDYTPERLTEMGYSLVDEKHTGTEAIVFKQVSTTRQYKTITHEVLHLLGLHDRYIDNKSTSAVYSIPIFGFEKDIMGGGANIEGGSIIDQAHYNNWGRFILAQSDNEFLLQDFVDVTGDGFHPSYPSQQENLIGKYEKSGDGKKMIDEEDNLGYDPKKKDND